MTLNPAGGHFGEGDGATGFLVVFGFFVGVAFTVAFGVGVAVALAVGVGVFVAAKPCAGISARQSPITMAVRFIDHSIGMYEVRRKDQSLAISR
jgi:hypothetical protein